MALSAFFLFLLPGFLITHVKVSYYMQRKKTETIRWVESLLISPIFYVVIYYWRWSRENILSGIIKAFQEDDSIFSADVLRSILYLSIASFIIGFAYQWSLKGLYWLQNRLPKGNLIKKLLLKRKSSFDSAWNAFFFDYKKKAEQAAEQNVKIKMTIALKEGKQLTGYCRSISQDFGSGHRDVWLEQVTNENDVMVAESLLVDASQVSYWYYI